MGESYDIYFAGKIVDGFDEATVRANMAKLFKANPETVEKLFSGKPQLIKRGVEKAAAIKYKGAMQKAGAVPLIRASGGTKAAAEPAPAPAAPNNEPAAPGSEPEPQQQTMAERLAALTGEPAPEAGAEESTPTTTPAAAASPVSDAGSGISLAPPGSDVLNADERSEFQEADVNTSAIHLAPEFAEPEVTPREEPPAPDTSHMSMGEVGEDIPTLENALIELDPDISHMSMGEVGEEIPHLELDQEPVDVDTSAIDLAPEGSDVLEEQYKKKDEAEAPDTSHIKMASTFDAPS